MRTNLKHINKAALLCLVFLCLGTGCVAKTKVETRHAPAPESAERMVEDRIEGAASEILEKLTLLARLEEQDALARGQVTAQPKATDPALLQPLPMLWDGPLEPAVQSIAHTIGWTFDVTGSRPLQPVVVQIRSKDFPVQRVLEDCGWQAGDNVAVLIDQGAKLLKVVYLPEHDG